MHSSCAGTCCCRILNGGIRVQDHRVHATRSLLHTSRPGRGTIRSESARDIFTRGPSASGSTSASTSVPNGFLTTPFAYDGLTDRKDFEGRTISWLQVVPVSDSERLVQSPPVYFRIHARFQGPLTTATPTNCGLSWLRLFTLREINQMERAICGYFFRCDVDKDILVSFEAMVIKIPGRCTRFR